MIVILHDPGNTQPKALAAMLIGRYRIRNTIEAWDCITPLKPFTLDITTLTPPRNLPGAIVIRVGHRRPPPMPQPATAPANPANPDNSQHPTP